MCLEGSASFRAETARFEEMSEMRSYREAARAVRKRHPDEII